MTHLTSVKAVCNVKISSLDTYSGNCYLGIDAGSTTTKAALVGEDGSLLYSFYSNNNGNPLATSIVPFRKFTASFLPALKLPIPVLPDMGDFN